MIKLIKSTFYNETETKKKLADFVLTASQLSMGAECQKFEQAFAIKQVRKYAVFVANGSAANLLLIQALMNNGTLKKGDRIGVSAVTWATNIMPLIQLGLEVEIIDCNLATLNISPATLQPHLTKIKALFLTNVLGLGDEINEIKDICAEQKILLLEDNCESLGSKIGNCLLGNFGLASTFSFFVGHHMSTIEGGMIVTDDKRLYHSLVMARAHGWDRNLPAEVQSSLRKKNNIDDFHAKYTFYDLAYNVRPTELQGFLGNIQLDYLTEIVQKRAENFAIFMKVINDNNDFIRLDLLHMSLISNFAVPVICRNQESVEKYKKIFEDHDVEIRPIIAGNIAKQPFFKKYISDDFVCENANQIHNYGFYFPNNPELDHQEIDLIVSLLSK
ncbi:MAG: DegT/DnrJ/EryC1/StrS aminotransferase family protein [bacterium]